MMKSIALLCLPMLILVAASGIVLKGTRNAQEGTGKMLNRSNLNGIELEYEIKGTGEPVILAHAGVLHEFFKPLFNEPALTERYRIVRYHRAGYAGSSRVKGSISIKDHAAHLRALMNHLGIDRAH